MSGMPRSVTAVLASAAAAATAAAGEVATHQFDLPTLPLSVFGLQFTADYLGPPEGEIVLTRADLTFTTDETFDAADIVLSFQAPSEGVPVWQFSGADLGWSGAGTFTADLATETLNGVIDLGDPPPDFSLFFLSITAVDLQPLGGQFTDSSFIVSIAPPPTCPADLDGDDTVGTTDFLDLLAQWGTDPGGPPDLDGDGTVGTTDFLALLAAWGPCP